MTEYLEAGCRLVWVVDTDERTVAGHRPGSAPRVIDEHESLDGESVIPGFRYPLSEFFGELD